MTLRDKVKEQSSGKEQETVSSRYALNAVDKVEIITLADNYIDLIVRDDSEIVSRGAPLTHDLELRDSFLAEHGFSVLVRCVKGEVTRTMVFDFGLAWDVAVRNADTSGVDLAEVEAATLSHGHIDHFGGLAEVAGRIGKTGIEFVVHPSVFRPNRYIMSAAGSRLYQPQLTRQQVNELGFRIMETRDPYLMLDGDALFLGEIPRMTSFEKGTPNAFYDQDGKEVWDSIQDDTGIAMMLSGRGLVILSGCSHSGIVNTVEHARKVTGTDKVHAVIGGFHLCGEAFAPIVDDTVRSIRQIDPDYVVPTHCTGREATIAFEKAMPSEFILNMVGTRLTFSS